jgi:hypothetical protein
MLHRRKHILSIGCEHQLALKGLAVINVSTIKNERWSTREQVQVDWLAAGVSLGECGVVFLLTNTSPGSIAQKHDSPFMH